MASMTADDFVRYLSWALFGVLCLRTAWQAARRPTRVNVNIALLFGVAGFIIAVAVLQSGRVIAQSPWLTAATQTALIALPYLLFRLTDDVIGVSPVSHGVVVVGLAASAASVWALPVARIGWLATLILLYLVAVLLYASGAVAAAVWRARGVTRRRLAAVMAGSLLLLLNLVVGNLPRWLPALDGVAQPAADLLGLAVGLSYYVGFTPPHWLRSAWQEPELRAFLERAARLPRLPDREATVRALADGSASAVGAPAAAVGLWDEQRRALVFPTSGGPLEVDPASDMPAAEAFREQRAIFSPAARSAAWRADGRGRPQAVLAAPISVAEQRLGVLVVYGPQAPIFADDDLALVSLLADQAAVILECRRLIDEAARVQAREEAARLKEDFLSAAAHDLKTPLTTLVVQAQLLERRALRSPDAPADLSGIRRMIGEGVRLRAMIFELLDAAQAGGGVRLGQRSAVDLADLVRSVVARYETPRHRFRVEAAGAVVGQYDGERIAQLVENLVENAVKYSPQGGPVELSVWQAGGAAHLSVSDRGIGIPADDLPRLFDRFHRGRNVDDRRFPGLGLGLYICHGIVEQHGGTISVESQPGSGTTFHVTLPLTAVPMERYAAEYSHHR